MKQAAVAVVVLLTSWASAAEVLVEAEGLARYGGWVLDPQFLDIMGSPYLLAHGLGKPVGNATTEVEFPQTGTYRLWVRTSDWVPSHHPGRFKVIVDGAELAVTFGVKGAGWLWQDGGTVEIRNRKAAVQLKDLTGFDGRCDALYFTTDRRATPPAKPGDKMAAWRRDAWFSGSTRSRDHLQDRIWGTGPPGMAGSPLSHVCPHSTRKNPIPPPPSVAEVTGRRCSRRAASP